MNEKIIYEVIRIINAKPLFVLDHYERLKSSILGVYANSEVISKQDFINLIIDKIQSSNLTNANIMIEFSRSDTSSSDFMLSIKEIPHHYPSDEEYKFGVDLGLYKHERENPELKILKQDLRKKVDIEISARKVYELLYYDDNNNISEGTRSNFFFLNDKNLFSAPLDKVLPGITRKYIVKMAKKLGFNIMEREISIFELDLFESAFISGTSPKILPVKRINNFKFDVNNQNLRLLMSEFENVIDKNLSIKI